MKNKTIATLFLASLTIGAAITNMGCSVISSAGPSSTTVSGEAWYARTGAFGGLKGIYYCPAATPTQCMQAEIH